MRALLHLALAGIALPGAALAHVGHLGELAGHSHWVAGAAIGAAVAIGLWGVLAGRPRPAPASAPEEEVREGGEDAAAEEPA